MGPSSQLFAWDYLKLFAKFCCKSPSCVSHKTKQFELRKGSVGHSWSKNEGQLLGRRFNAFCQRIVNFSRGCHDNNSHIGSHSHTRIYKCRSTIYDVWRVGKVKRFMCAFSKNVKANFYCLHNGLNEESVPFFLQCKRLKQFYLLRAPFSDLLHGWLVGMVLVGWRGWLDSCFYKCRGTLSPGTTNYLRWLQGATRHHSVLAIATDSNVWPYMSAWEWPPQNTFLFLIYAPYIIISYLEFRSTLGPVPKPSFESFDLFSDFVASNHRRHEVLGKSFDFLL